MHAIQFCFGLVHFELKIINLDFFPGQIVTSLSEILQWKKPYPKKFSGIKFFICYPIFKIFVALFKTYGMQNGDMVIFFTRSFRQLRFRKMQFLKDGV